MKTNFLLGATAAALLTITATQVAKAQGPWNIGALDSTAVSDRCFSSRLKALSALC